MSKAGAAVTTRRPCLGLAAAAILRPCSEPDIPSGRSLVKYEKRYGLYRYIIIII